MSHRSLRFVALLLAVAGCADGSGPDSGGHGIRQIVAAADYACAVDSLGQAWCWGAGNLGQLGSGDTIGSVVPLPVAGRLVIARMTAGDFHACALTARGVPWCWGTNFTGVLGIGQATGPEPLPLQVGGGHHFTAISAGGEHTCALDADGMAWCWGQGGQGRLGTADGTNHFLPAAVQTDQRFVAVTAGFAHTCGLTAEGDAFCWGSNFRGQLGTGDTLDALVPRPVVGGERFRQLDAGGYHTCGLVQQSGEARCWGNDVTAELGDGRLVPEAIVMPVPVAGGRHFTRLTVGNYHACAITASGAAWCWGQSVYGKLGNDDFVPTAVPVAVAGGIAFRNVAAASNHTCAASRDGRLFCWGRNSLGQLGTGDNHDALAPVEVAPLE
jgi:alpha-tubulin suppressor-like RCC1 family protein